MWQVCFQPIYRLIRVFWRFTQLLLIIVVMKIKLVDPFKSIHKSFWHTNNNELHILMWVFLFWVFGNSHGRNIRKKLLLQVANVLYRWRGITFDKHCSNNVRGFNMHEVDHLKQHLLTIKRNLLSSLVHISIDYFNSCKIH